MMLKPGQSLVYCGITKNELDSTNLKVCGPQNSVLSPLRYTFSTSSLLTPRDTCTQKKQGGKITNDAILTSCHLFNLFRDNEIFKGLLK